MEVANFLNFSRAAERLRITQPAVSHQISTLEDELNEAGMMTITEKRQSTAEIVYGEEILIAIQGITSNHEAASLSVSDFDNPQALLDAGYERAYAVTIIFADKK